MQPTLIEHFYNILKEGRKEVFYLTTHSTHFSNGYMASDVWYMTIQRARKENRCRHMGYSFQLAARVLLYAPSHRQDNSYHGICYTSRGALAETRNSIMSERSYHGSTVCMYICIFVCMYVCMHVCVSVHACVCACVYIYVCITISMYCL